jgi:predicted DNA-binding transcriptional regulator YafY
MDQPKLDRLLRIMKMLTGNLTYSVAEIAERMHTSPRTVYRYIDTFRDAGFVIKKKDHAVRIDRTSPHFKEISSLIHFTHEEAHILKRAIEAIDETNLIKQNLKKKLYTVYDYKILADTVVKGKNAQNVNQLVEAIENKRRVVLCDYSSAHGQSVRSRLVEPFAFTTNYIQLWAYEPEAEESKLFKLSRIASVKVLEAGWAHPSEHKVGHLDIFRLSSEDRLPVRLRLSLRAAQLLMEEYPLAETYLTQVDEARWILDTEVCSFEGVGRFVMGLTHEIEVLETAAFKKYLQQRLQQIKI